MICWILACAGTGGLQAQEAIQANRSVPAVTMPTAKFALAGPVTTASLRQVRLFPEPLVPVGDAPTASENEALANVLRAFAAAGNRGVLDAFVKTHPDSPWRVSVLTNLGLLKFDAGYFSAALADWNLAWQQGNRASNQTTQAEAITIRALAEALKMNCRVGRVADAKALLTELGDRQPAGLNASMIDESRKAIIQMDTMPADCFKCGPYALSSILAHTKQHTPESIARLTAFPTTAQGTSLDQVTALANEQLGMKMQPAKRVSLDAPILLPSVIHWKLNHYGALLEKKDGLYLMVDPTFGTSQWIGEDAIHQEASGYFVVPAGPLPTGWVAVNETEAGTIWGRGDCAVGDGNGTGPNSPKKGGKGDGCGMAVWSIHHALASLNIEDIPLFYQPPVGPAVYFRVNYSQLEQNQPTTVNFSNIGPLWNFSWISSITFDSANARVRMGEGGTELYTNFNSTTNTYDPEQSSNARLVKISATTYERRETDGSAMVFAQPDGSGRIFVTQIVDPQGNALSMTYDANFRLVALTDAVGQVSVLTHGSNTPGDPQFYLVTQVTDPFGRFTTLNYNANGRLIAVTDQIGITSAFTYNGAGLVDTMNTPYGQTTFNCGTANVPVKGVVSHVNVTEPNGAQERVESLQYSTTPTSEAAVPTGIPLVNLHLQYRNSYYWDAKAMLDGAGDYSKASLTHFLHLNISSIKANVIESEKNPLESRIWYFYPNQASSIFTNPGMGASPTHVARLLDDGSTQLDRYSYNPQGNVTQSIDPLGRTTNYSYAANGVDVLTVSQVNAQGGSDTLVTFTWNTQHLPLTITDTAGSVTACTYNARGQLTGMTNALGESVSYAYDALGRLLSADGPLAGTGDRSTFTHDSLGRVDTATNGEGYAVDVDYDALDRVTKVTYPDGTFEETTYTYLDATQVRDRMAKLTTMAYDSVRQPVSITDPLNRVIKLEWCKCGALKRMIDPLGRVTKWDQDIQGRTISKTYADGSKEAYTYEATNSRLASVTDAKGQTKALSYHADDTTAGIVYLNAQQKTPAVSFAYDAAYPRLVSMTDGLGVTSYSYGEVTGSAPGANQLKEVNTLWNGVNVTYSHDILGRVLSRAIDGISLSVARDAGGRTSAMTNALGTFGYTFENASDRITGISLPNGQSMVAAYLGNTNDRRLQQIRNVQPNAATLSQSDLAYDATGQITAWNQQASGNPALNYNLGYDSARQLTSMTAAGRDYGYSYDAAGNLKTKSLNGTTTGFASNILNELQAATPALGGDKTYLWDAENRLVGILYAGGILNTRLKYDGMGRCVEIVENNGTTPVSTKRFVWCGLERCEERDASGNVTRRFFPQGEQIGGASYYYAFDHLGSVREMTDSTGAIRARYDYDPYGVRTKLAGDLDATRGYTGHYVHAPSGLHLTLFRAYDAQTARWLSRDPLGESAGANLYGYAGNNPARFTDPLGLLTANAGVGLSGVGGAAGGLSAGLILDTEGNIGIYGGVDYGAGAGLSYSADVMIGGTGASNIFEATSGNNGTVGMSGALGGKLGATASWGKESNGDSFAGVGLSTGVGIGTPAATATTGPSGIAKSINVPDGVRKAAEFFGADPNKYFPKPPKDASPFGSFPQRINPPKGPSPGKAGSALKKPGGGKPRPGKPAPGGKNCPK